jgi:hypothetical protein
VWLLGSFAVLSLLYRADQAPAAAEPSAEQVPTSADVAPNSAQTPSTDAEVLTKRAQPSAPTPDSAPPALRPAALSWPPLLGSAPATPAPSWPSSRLDLRPSWSRTATAPPRLRPTGTRRPRHDRRPVQCPRGTGAPQCPGPDPHPTVTVVRIQGWMRHS